MILLQHDARATTDDAVSAVHPPPGRARYSLPTLDLHRLPSLAWLCLCRLAEFPDQLHHLPVRLRVADDAPLSLDIADAVRDPHTLDPRLWATLVQVCDNLPPHLASFSTPLADPHVPLLQRIPATPRFALLTVLDLPACRHLTDDTVSELAQLHSLAAFDASATTLSSYAVTVLARTLHWSTDSLCRGLVALRILRLYNCVAIDNSVYPQLARFPHLSIVDLRGTRCTPPTTILDAFCPADATQSSLYHPASLHAALQALSSPQPLYSSPHTFTLHINSLYHGPPPARLAQPTIASQNTFVVIPSAESRSAITTGDSEVLLRRAEKAEELRRREKNKEAWYARNSHRLRSGDPDTMEAMGLLDDLSDSDDKGRSSLRRSNASPSLPPISRPLTYYPSERERNNLKTPQRPIASTSSFYRVPSDVRSTQKKPTAMTSSFWIGEHRTQASTRKSSMPVPVRPMPQSSFSGSSCSLPPMQLPPISASTANFYSTVPTNPRAPLPTKLKGSASGWDWDYSADRYYSAAHQKVQGRHDAALMLYRPPPPWNVEGVNPRTRNTRGERMGVLAGGGVLRVRHVERVASVIDHKRVAAVREKETALVALQESAKRYGGALASVGPRNWQGENGTPVAGKITSDLGTTMNMGRNPFRRRMAANISDIGRETMKPLKPISAVKIPLLPKSALEREPKRRKTTSDVKMSEPALACEHTTPTNSNTTVIMTAHKLHPTRAHLGDEKTKRRNSTPSSRSKLQTKKCSSSEPGHTIEANATATPSKGTGTRQQGFNWSSWGVK